MCLSLSCPFAKTNAGASVQLCVHILLQLIVGRAGLSLGAPGGPQTSAAWGSVWQLVCANVINCTFGVTSAKMIMESSGNSCLFFAFFLSYQHSVNCIMYMYRRLNTVK